MNRGSNPLIALAAIGLSTGVMLPANAAALVGAGVLSVLVYPLIAIALTRRGAPSPPGQTRQRPGWTMPARVGLWAPPAPRASPAPRTMPTAPTATALPRPGSGLGQALACPCLFPLDE
jgi:hypothetical protein